MNIRLGIAASALAGLALGLAACASTPPDRQWTRPGATPEDVRTALYWCSQTKVDPSRALGTPADGDRRTRTEVDAECMEGRGFSRAPGQK